MRNVRTGLGLAAALLLVACGSKSTDTVEDSKLTVMNGAGLIEGTTNDSATLETGMNSAVTAVPTPAPDVAKNDTAEPDNAARAGD